MIRTLTEQEVRKIYGDPTNLVRDDGAISGAWESTILDWCPLPAPLPLSWDPTRKITRFRCHRLLVTQFRQAFDEIYRMPEVWATIGDFGGCYNWRTRRGQKRKLSLHCWGIAVDLDVADNPDGGAPQVHPGTVDAFERAGFYWGGYFKGNDQDPMHWEVGAGIA